MTYLPARLDSFAAVKLIPADVYERLLEAVFYTTKYRVPYFVDNSDGTCEAGGAEIYVCETSRKTSYRQIEFHIINVFMDRVFAIQLPLGLDYKLCNQTKIEFLPRTYIHTATLISLLLTTSMDDLATELQTLLQSSEPPTYDWDL